MSMCRNCIKAADAGPIETRVDFSLGAEVPSPGPVVSTAPRPHDCEYPVSCTCAHRGSGLAGAADSAKGWVEINGVRYASPRAALAAKAITLAQTREIERARWRLVRRQTVMTEVEKS